MNSSVKELSLNEMSSVNGGEAILIGAFIFAGIVCAGACIYGTMDGYKEQQKESGGASGSW